MPSSKIPGPVGKYRLLPNMWFLESYESTPKQHLDQLSQFFAVLLVVINRKTMLLCL